MYSFKMSRSFNHVYFTMPYCFKLNRCPISLGRLQNGLSNLFSHNILMQGK